MFGAHTIYIIYTYTFAAFSFIYLLILNVTFFRRRCVVHIRLNRPVVLDHRIVGQQLVLLVLSVAQFIFMFLISIKWWFSFSYTTDNYIYDINDSPVQHTIRLHILKL